MIVWVLILTMHGHGKLAVSNMGEFETLKQCETFEKTVYLEMRKKFTMFNIDTLCVAKEL